MRILSYFLSGYVIVMLAGCNNKETTQDNKSIIGIWQNTTNPDAAIEFTRDGDYYLRLYGERILAIDSTFEKYSYDPLSKENNLIIYNNPKISNTQASLVILNPNRIKISLVHQGSIVSEAEFAKVKEE